MRTYTVELRDGKIKIVEADDFGIQEGVLALTQMALVIWLFPLDNVSSVSVEYGGPPSL